MTQRRGGLFADLFAPDTLLPGAIALFIILSFVAGGPVGAWTLVMASVICTGGVGLVVWIPLAWGSGMVVKLLLRLVRSGASASHSSEDRRRTALVPYVHRAMLNGIPRERVERMLGRHGWTAAEVGEAWRRAEAEGRA